eukprot:jgi/Mesvir1/18616/Mv17125-RA.1
MQNIRKRVPGIRFVIEEADLYKRNILSSEPELLAKLQHFVGAIYIYDILINLMRELNDRVERATDASLIDTSREEMARLMNALRGYVAAETGVDYNTKAASVEQSLSHVYMNRIPADVLARVTDLEDDDQYGTPLNANDPKLFKIPNVGLLANTTSPYLRMFDITYEDLPLQTILLEDDPADDCIPARLIQQLASRKIDCSFLSIPHRLRLAKLNVDYPPIAFDYARYDALTSIDKTMYIKTEDELTLPMAADFQQAVIKRGFAGEPFVVEVVQGNAFISDDDDPARLLSQYKIGDEFCHSFPNIIQKYIKRDIIAFNRLRSQILNVIDNWWRQQGALNLVDGMDADNVPKDRQSFYSDLLLADYRLSGNPGTCPRGTDAVYYDRDPSDPKAQIVDQFIIGAGGKEIFNPKARSGPHCADIKHSEDIVTGLPSYSDDVEISGPHYVGARRYKRRPVHRSAATRVGRGRGRRR